MRADDLAPLIARKPPPAVRYRQGTVIEWDPITADNVIAVGGAIVSNLTTLNASEVAVIRPGDRVSILTLGRGVRTWFVVGRMTIPGGAESAIVQSFDYDPGVAGYTLDRTGFAEFQDLLARGDIGARSITLPPNAGTGTPRLVLGPDLPAPLDTYLWSGSQLAVGGIIYRQGDVGDDNYTFLVMVVFPGQVLVHLGHVLDGVMQEITPGFPKGQAWSYNGTGVQTQIHTGGSEDTLSIGNRWTGNASGGDFTTLDLIANVVVGGSFSYTPSNPAPNLTVKGNLTVSGSGLGVGVAENVLTGGAVTATTTETLIGSITATLNSLARYKFTADLSYQSTVANDLVTFKFRYAAGATVSNSSTLFGTRSCQCASSASRGLPVRTGRRLPASLSGQYTVGVFLVRGLGSGTVQANASATDEAVLTLDRVS